MAGDFVMVQHATPRKPEVIRLARLLGITRLHAFGLCVAAWMWFDEQTETGHAFGVTHSDLDETVSHKGFSKALEDVGWLAVEDGAIVAPRFDKLMGQSAKKRANAAERQRNHRHASVTQVSHKKRDKSVTKEEKRREEIEKREENTPIPPKQDIPPPAAADAYTAEFLEFWLVFPATRKGAKRTAWKAWKAAITRATGPFIIEAAREYANSDVGRSQYAKGPAVWLNGDCWEDDREAWRRPSDNGKETIGGFTVGAGQRYRGDD